MGGGFFLLKGQNLLTVMKVICRQSLKARAKWYKTTRSSSSLVQNNMLIFLSKFSYVVNNFVVFIIKLKCKVPW